MAKPRTAWVLAGGGSLGAIQVGMLKALVAAQVPCDAVVGASVGALNGAVLAARPDADGLADLERLWCSLRRNDVFPLSLPSVLRHWLSGTGAISSSGALRRLIGHALTIKRLQDTRIPLTVIATDLLNGEEIRLSECAIEPALMASAAIPAVFPPVHHDGRWLADGGIASHTPIAAAIAQDAERVLVLPTGMSCALREPPRGVAAAALHALNLLIMRQVIDDIRRFGSAHKIAVVPPLCPLNVNIFDFSQTAGLIQRAEAATHTWLDSGGLDHSTIPETLKPHRH
ncbi:MAG: patatin-like phospholipase family protein [Gammaproteobacteria bacterium]|nr:patatin-like phospholipase family protein [Gammaproteobacteria bacterium]